MEESSSNPFQADTAPTAARRRFPGLPSQIAYARRFVARQLASSPDVTTATLLTSELATNAITHSASGRDTGKFEVCVHHAPGWARVEVRDLGSTMEAPQPQHRDPYDTAEHGRGLDLVEALASKWGTEPRRDGRGRQVWFELVWDGDDRSDDRPECEPVPFWSGVFRSWVRPSPCRDVPRYYSSGAAGAAGAAVSSAGSL